MVADNDGFIACPHELNGSLVNLLSIYYSTADYSGRPFFLPARLKPTVPSLGSPYDGDRLFTSPPKLTARSCSLFKLVCDAL